MENKYCFKSDGTKERGAKIIKALEELGGSTLGVPWAGTETDYFYYINKFGSFKNSPAMPEGYTLIEPDEILNGKTFPREMYVSDISEENALICKRIATIYTILEDPRIGKQYVGVATSNYFIGFIHAVDIPKEKKEEPVLELTLDEIAKKFDVSVNNLKIRK